MKSSGLCVARGIVCLVVAMTLTTTSAQAAPTLTKLSLRGLEIGGHTTLTIEGTDLLPAPSLVLPVKIARQTVQPGATAKKLAIEVELNADVPPGIYPLRLANAHGISNALGIGLDDLPQMPFAGQVEKLPAALSGELTGSAILAAQLSGQKGQRLVAEVESRRLGANLRPVVRVLDDRGTQLAWSAAHPTIGGDARCELNLPADGRYTVQVHDMLYRSAAGEFFRLKLGPLHYADLALPLAVTAGNETALEAASASLPPGTKLRAAVDAAAADDQIVSLPATPLFTGAPPRVLASPLKEEVEQPRPAPDKPQELSAAPVAVSGRLALPDEQDRYLVEVKPGSKLRLELVARRWGSPLDGVLEIRNPAGAQLASADDQKETSDPGADFTVPANVRQLLLVVRDLARRGGDEFVYRLAVREAGSPDFSLALDTDRLNIPAGGATILKVTAARNGYAGPIALEFEGFPPSVTVAGSEIAAGANIALVTLSAAPGSASFGLGRIVGRSEGGTPAIAHVARPATAPGTYWSLATGELGLAVTEPSPLAIRWASAGDDDRLLQGTAYPARVALTRAPEAKGQVRLSLVTNQTALQKEIVDPKDAKKKITVDDLDRMLRLAEGSITVTTDEHTAAILVPGDLPLTSWDLVLRAELLSADQKTVLATAITPVRRLGVAAPLTVELAGAAKVEAKAGLGETGQLTGKVTRAAGFSGPVTVTLAGLPAGYAAPQSAIAADRDDFQLTVNFPFGAKPGPLKNVRLVATASGAGEGSVSVVRSNEIPVDVVVVAGKKPAAEQPLAIFEDDPAFVSLLTEGSGEITLDEGDKYSGQASLRVTPDQRYSPKLPGLGVKIRQNPGPGEYRYLCFAWRKYGGASICLQVNHDGAWGPGGSGKPGAKFRYHSGPGGECYGASVLVDEQIPNEWVVVTRDLFADFGEFTFTGLALSPVDARYAVFDHLYLGRSPADFDLVKP